MLAKNVNDDAFNLNLIKRSALGIFASKLAPTNKKREPRKGLPFFYLTLTVITFEATVGSN